jgi:hypothetical protein
VEWHSYLILTAIAISATRMNVIGERQIIVSNVSPASLPGTPRVRWRQDRARSLAAGDALDRTGRRAAESATMTRVGFPIQERRNVVAITEIMDSLGDVDGVVDGDGN